MALLGIEDPWIWLAYLLCVASTLICIIYGLVTRSRGEEPVKQEDITWAAEEKTVEEEL
jgi:hypothetical protein